MNYMPQPKDNLREMSVEYRYLTCLDIKCVHTDSIEQFFSRIDEKELCECETIDKRRYVDVSQ